MPVFDENGNELEGGLSPEEAKVLKEQAAELAEAKEKLAKLEAKDMNFERFRHKTETEKQEILKTMTAKEQMLMKEIEAAQLQVESYQKNQMESAKEALLKQIAGDDLDYRKSIENQEKEFIGKAETPEQLKDRYIKAATLVKGKKPSVAPLNYFSPVVDHTQPDVSTKKDFVETDKGVALYEKMFGHKPGELPKKK